MIVYAKDLDRLVRFYCGLFDLEVVESEVNDFAYLEGRDIALSIVQVPSEISKSIHVSEPPDRRGDTPVKHALPIPSIAKVRSLANDFGGLVCEKASEWMW